MRCKWLPQNFECAKLPNFKTGPFCRGGLFNVQLGINKGECVLNKEIYIRVKIRIKGRII